MNKITTALKKRKTHMREKCLENSKHISHRHKNIHKEIRNLGKN